MTHTTSLFRVPARPHLEITHTASADDDIYPLTQTGRFFFPPPHLTSNLRLLGARPPPWPIMAGILHRACLALLSGSTIVPFHTHFLALPPTLSAARYSNRGRTWHGMCQRLPSQWRDWPGKEGPGERDFLLCQIALSTSRNALFKNAARHSIAPTVQGFLAPSPKLRQKNE